MRKERVTEEEIRAAVREAGYGSMEKVEAVILETDAELSVLGQDFRGLDTDVLEGVRTPERQEPRR